MGLYSTFNTAQYYDEEPIIKKPVQKPVEVEQPKPAEYKKPHQVAGDIGSEKRKSLYAEAQHVASSRSEYGNKDFRDLYRVGQMVTIQAPGGKFRTKQGRIIEIVAKDLMYVGMEDTFKDVNGNWLMDFVTAKDIVTRL